MMVRQSLSDSRTSTPDKAVHLLYEKAVTANPACFLEKNFRLKKSQSPFFRRQSAKKAQRYAN